MPHSSRVSPLEKCNPMEFDKLVKNLDAFFKKERRTLQFLTEAKKNEPRTNTTRPYSGWEKWWQIEWAKHLQTEYDVSLETPLIRDNRKNKTKSTNYLDLVLWPKGKQERYVGIELKTKEWPEYAIKGSLVDLKGFYELTPSSWEDWGFRSIISISAYFNHRNKSSYEALIPQIEGMKHGRGHIQKLPSGWKMAIFGWEAPLKEATYENFLIWYQQVRQIVADSNLSLSL